MVRLIKDGEEFKMSKRAGKVITIRDLLDKFGKNVLRYFIASKQLQSHFDLDISLLEDKSSNSPLHYSMYSYVRAKSIINELGKTIKIKKDHKFGNLKETQENELVKSLSKMQNIIERAARLREAQVLIVYIDELSQLFHSFYSSCKIKDEQEKIAEERFMLVQAYVYAISNLYKIVGIEPIEKM
jgi:arginyl-tRNA synthetase